MSYFKRILAIGLVIVFALSFSACRAKDETILTYKDSEGNSFSVRSAIYLLYMIDSDSDFKSQIDSQTSAQATTTASAVATTQAVDYFSKKLDDKDYVTWVKDNALELCSEYAYVQIQFKKLGLKLSDDVQSYFNYYVDYYWDQGYSTVCEANGISYDSYSSYYENQFKSNAVFEYYYVPSDDKTDKVKGSLAPSDAEILKSFKENYVLADSIAIDFSNSSGTQTLTDEQKANDLIVLKNYAKRINEGESFATIKAEYDKAVAAQTTTTAAATTAVIEATKASQVAVTATTGSAKKSTTTAVAETTTSAASEKKLTPKDANAVAYGSQATGNGDECFTDVSALKTGAVKVLEYSDRYMLVVKKDITADPYYLDYYKSSTVSILKKTDFTDSVKANAAKLKVDKNESAISYYSPKRLDLDTTKS